MPKAVLVITFIFWISTLSYSQSFLSGYVRTLEGEPLPFASVYIQGTTKGTTSNADGAYTLELAPGTYQIVYQYIGYRSVVIPVLLPEDGFVQNVMLEEDILELRQVEVIANREDPAYEIIRKAQAKRVYYRDLVSEYKCRSYIKGSFRLMDAPEKVLGAEIGDMEGLLDSNRQGYLYLSESVSEIYFKAPDKKKEVMISSIVSGDPQGFSFNQASGMDFNFYENTIRFSRALISPIASNAFDYYRFRLEGVIFDSEGRMVNKISVIPKVREASVFEGTIYITEDLWNIHDVDVFTTKQSLKQPLIDTFWIKQIFVPIDSRNGEVWMMFNQQVKVKVGLFGFSSKGEFSAIFSNYNLNDPVPDKVFDENQLVVERGANERDSLYWEAIRPIPLTRSEIDDYVRKDSLRERWDSPEYLDSIDRVDNKFSLGAVLTFYSHRNSKKRVNWQISSPLLNLSFNPVQGYNSSMFGSWTKAFDNKRIRLLSFRVSGQYGLAEDRLNPAISGSYSWDGIYKQKLQLEWSRGLVTFDPSNPIIPFVASISNLYEKTHYMKLFREEKLQAIYSREIGRGFKLRVSSKWSARNPVRNKTEQSFLTGEADYPANMPLELPFETFSPDEQITTGVQIKWRPGMKYWSFPEQRIPIGSRFPVFTADYERAVPLSDEGADWERWQFSVEKQQIRLGSFGYTNVIARAGLFTRDENVQWPDLFHFNGNEVIWISASKYMNGFMQLPYFSNSSTQAFGSFHFEHHFDGTLLDRIPLINKLGWKSLIGYSRLQQESGRHWNEIYIGLENIGISLYRGIRINFVGSWIDQNKLEGGFRFSLVNAIGVQL